MRKIIWILTLFFGVSNVYAQEDVIPYYVDKCISLIGNSIPDEFQRIDRDSYRNNEGITVTAYNGIISYSMIAVVRQTNHEVSMFNVLFHDHFDNNNWIYLGKNIGGYDTYYKNGIYGFIGEPYIRDDGIVASIWFSRYKNLFFD